MNRRRPRVQFCAVGVLVAACLDGSANTDGDSAGTSCGDGVLDSGEECDDGNIEEGDGCSAVCVRSWRRAFISSTVQQGDFGGIAGADAICQGLADAVALGGTYLAWISDTTGTPADRFMRATVPYVVVGATPEDPRIIAETWDDLVDGQLTTSILYDERGVFAFSPTDVWTNTQPDGTLTGEFGSCGEWTTAGGTSGAVGNADSLGETWTRNTTTSCSMYLRLLCFEQ